MFRGRVTRRQGGCGCLGLLLLIAIVLLILWWTGVI